MKKSITLAALLTLILAAVCGCGQGPDYRAAPVASNTSGDPPNTTNDSYFIHVTDIHAWYKCDNEWWTAFVDMVNGLESRPQFVLATGDNVYYAGDEENFHALLAPLTTKDNSYYIDEARQIPIYFCTGNHDLMPYDCFYCNQEAREYSTFIGDPVYAMAVGDPEVLLISLRSGGWPFVRPQDDVGCYLPGDGVRPTDIRFLGLAIDSNSTIQTQIIMTHHPYTNGGTLSDPLCGTFQNSRDEFLDICLSRDVDLVLSGHIHGRAHDGPGDRGWNKDGGAWRPGDGTVFVVTDGLMSGFYRKIHLTGTGQIALIGPIESLRSVLGETSTDGVADNSLSQNHPNPFNPSTTTEFSLPAR